MIPTPEQSAILAAAQQSNLSLMIQAGAGCGKTSTMTMVANVLPPTPGLALAFNVKIKEELQKRFPQNFEILTLNGLGHRAWAKAIGKRLTLDQNKGAALLRELAKGESLDKRVFSDVLTLLRVSRSAGVVPGHFPFPGLRSDTQETWEDICQENDLELGPSGIALGRALLDLSCKRAFDGLIDFDDQIYMSALFSGVFPRYPLVMVDEAQDLSPLNHIMIKKTASGRLIVVGDPRQAIYGWRGADSQSMATLRKLRPEWIDLPLMLTFRCPKVVVERQQKHAPDFRAHDGNPQGHYSHWAKHVEAWKDGWGYAAFRTLSNGHPHAILCRNNGPMLSLAFKLIRQKIGLQVLGRDIGTSLVKLAEKIMPDPTTPAKDCWILLDNWAAREAELATLNHKEHLLERIYDRRACLAAVLESGGAETAGEVRQAIHGLFAKQNAQLTLSSIHRAKGLEWHTVMLLDPWRLPSKYSLGNPSAELQEANLRYVAETRAQENLVWANLEDFV